MASQEVGSIHYDLDLDDKKFKSKMSGVSDTVHGFGRSLENAEQGSKMFAATLAGIGVAGIGAIGFGVKMAADVETARQGFTTLLGSAEKANEAIEMIKRDAATTPFEFQGLVRANQMLTSVTKNAPQSEAMLLNVGKALAAAGKGSAELDNVIVNLQQIANTAHISEMDIRQFGFAGINILELLADYYGVTKEAAGEMVKDSKNAFADLEAAFAKAGGEGGKFSRAFIEQAGTFNQLMSNFKDTISQAAGEIVVSTGIFDAIKTGLANVIGILQQFQPQIVQGIKDLMVLIRDNGPLIAGIIIGGLTPAFVGLAGSILATMTPLLPFIAAGALLAIAIQEVVNQMGGWGEAQKRIQEALQIFMDYYNAYFKPAIDELWAVIRDELMPELQRLWETIGPILGPILKFLAGVIVGVVVAALYIFIELLKELIKWVADNIKKFNDMVDWFKSLKATIEGAMAGVKDALTKPFTDAWESIKDVAGKIKTELDKINPFHRNSPSLVDNVIKGVSVIQDEFAKLSDMTISPVANMAAGTAPLASREATTGPGSGVVVNVGHINSKVDLELVAQELGYRAGTMPA